MKERTKKMWYRFMVAIMNKSYRAMHKLSCNPNAQEKMREFANIMVNSVMKGSKDTASYENIVETATKMGLKEELSHELEQLAE